MENRYKKKGWCVILAGVLSCAAQVASAELVVIGNPGIEFSELTKEQVSDIFLAKTSKLPDGTAVTVIDQQDGTPIKEEFYSRVTGKNPSQLKAHWAKIVFTGKGVPPKSYSGDQAVKQQVANTPGAVGYVDDGAVDMTVKVLLKP